MTSYKWKKKYNFIVVWIFNAWMLMRKLKLQRMLQSIGCDNLLYILIIHIDYIYIHIALSRVECWLY